MAEIEPTQAHIERAVEMLNDDWNYAKWCSSDAPVQTLARALAAHDADRRAFSEVAKGVLAYADRIVLYDEGVRTVEALRPFILPEPVDPLRVIWDELWPEGSDSELHVRRLHKALAKHNLEIREIGE
jgi:hypothetical protein